MVQQSQPEYSVTWVNRFADIPQTDWDAFAQPLKTPFWNGSG
jgi:predicted N-acyltransferase